MSFSRLILTTFATVSLSAGFVVMFYISYHIDKSLDLPPPPLAEQSKFHETEDFCEQTKLILRSAVMSRAAVQRFTVLLAGLRHELQRTWPAGADFELTPFGSVATGLAFTRSDIDIDLTLGTCNTTAACAGADPRRLMQRTAAALRRNSSFTDITALYSTRGLSFNYVPTNQKCEVIFRTKHEHARVMADTRLLKYYMSLDRRVFPMMVLVKYWSNFHGLVLKRIMPNILWSWLVIFYLQQINILPSVSMLQKKAEPEINQHWNFKFEESYVYLYSTENNDSLYKILGGFFKYYANFDFENNVISIFAGTAIPRKMFADFEQLPEIFELYKSKVRKNVIRLLVTDSALCVQWPFNHNIAYKIFRSHHTKIFKKAEKCIKNAAEIYQSYSKENFVPAILS